MRYRRRRNMGKWILVALLVLVIIAIIVHFGETRVIQHEPLE